MDYQSIINGITFNSIIHLMEELGSPVCKETDEYSIEESLSNAMLNLFPATATKYGCVNVLVISTS